jgi:hypothetical protein
MSGKLKLNVRSDQHGIRALPLIRRRFACGESMAAVLRESTAAVLPLIRHRFCRAVFVVILRHSAAAVFCFVTLIRCDFAVPFLL